jgi:hypothetical protein
MVPAEWRSELECESRWIAIAPEDPTTPEPEWVPVCLIFDADRLVSLSTGRTEPVSFPIAARTFNAACVTGHEVARLNGWTVRGWCRAEGR